MKKIILSKDDVLHIAKLAKLNINDKLIDKYQHQMTDIVGFVSELEELKTEGVTPTSQVTGLVNVFRDDIISPSMSQEEVLANAPRKHNGFFLTDAVFK